MARSDRTESGEQQSDTAGATRYKLDPDYLAPDPALSRSGRARLTRLGFRQLEGDIPMEAAMRATAGCLLRWATRFRAWPVYGSEETVREGRLGTDPDEKATALDEVYTWLEVAPIPAGYLRLSALQLYAGEQLLLHHAHGSFEETGLHLTAGQFAALQDCLASAGLPPDLYYPAHALRSVQEPAILPGTGGVVLATRSYSPAEWRRREREGPPAVRLPTEEERRRRFALAIGRLRAVATARLAQLEGRAAAADQEERAQQAALLERLETIDWRYAAGPAHTVDAGGDEALLLAGEETVVQERLAGEYHQFLRALNLRRAEVREPGKALDREEERDLNALGEALQPVHFRAYESLLLLHRRRQAPPPESER